MLLLQPCPGSLNLLNLLQNIPENPPGVFAGLILLGVFAGLILLHPPGSLAGLALLQLGWGQQAQNLLKSADNVITAVSRIGPKREFSFTQLVIAPIAFMPAQTPLIALARTRVFNAAVIESAALHSTDVLYFPDLLFPDLLFRLHFRQQRNGPRRNTNVAVGWHLQDDRS